MQQDSVTKNDLHFFPGTITNLNKDVDNLINY